MDTVQYVVTHVGRPDGPAEGEAAVVAGAPDWLEPVWSDAGWRIYRVKDAVPLVAAPASVIRGDSAELVIRVARGPGVRTAGRGVDLADRTEGG